MEHLALHRDNQNVPNVECKGPCTPYHLSTRIYDLRAQKQERVQMILELLRTNKFVSTELGVSHATYYAITEAGYAWHRDRGVPFMGPFMPVFSPGKA
jgi:hypothetical protein